MDTEKCKVLLKAVDLGSFTKAAEELGYTPSGVTHMMNALEEDLGVTLLQRNRSGVALTNAGEELIASIRDLVASAEKMDQNVAKVHGLEVGHVAFASGASFARYMVPEIAARFHSQFPNITLEMIESGGGEMHYGIDSRRFHIGFLTRRESDRNFISLCGDDMLAVVPEDHPLAKKSCISMAELLRYPYICINRDYDHDVDLLLDSSGYDGRPFLVSRDEQAVLALVRAGLGVSVVAGMHVAFASEGVVGLPLDPPYIRDVGIATIPPVFLSPAERKFIDVAREVVAEMIEDGIVLPPR